MSPDPKTVREIAREALRVAIAQRRDISVGAAIYDRYDMPMLSQESFRAWHEAVSAEYDRMAAALARPDEQQPADVVTAEQQDGAAGRLRTAHALRAEHGIYDFAFDDDDVAAVLAELDALATRVAELEGEREADARAALALLKLGEVLYLGQRPTDWADARRQLIARFADRIEALAAAETEES